MYPFLPPPSGRIKWVRPTWGDTARSHCQHVYFFARVFTDERWRCGCCPFPGCGCLHDTWTCLELANWALWMRTDGVVQSGTLSCYRTVWFVRLLPDDVVTRVPRWRCMCLTRDVVPTVPTGLLWLLLGAL